ncbi:EF-hand domain-containing protein [Streptomyces sp. SP18ES09]|uniref:EF-hand domain-containing protein n=1 Tax=Streptomyces sp. SP18ES09 TaxID=3002532 RepID=UPI002E772A81|nr:EF-hand domain-containing protein [Streptomyces sp. SP18ES09]MEE1819786.1 EF-hand domain-containing protein [Streptomyces sp. SP18ES09]
MASSFQRAKVQAMFEAFDADGNGYLEERDFEALAARWELLPRVASGPELTARVRAVMLGWWQHLSTVAGGGRAEQIDLDDLMAMVDRLPAMREAVVATADVVFDAVDENGDGRISRHEHGRLVDTWHGRSIPTGDVFDRLDQDGDGFLSRPEFALLWTQFWTSDDPAEPGNLMCGPVTGTPAA